MIIYLSKPNSQITSMARFSFSSFVNVFGSRRRAAYVNVSFTVRWGNSTSSWVTNPILPYISCYSKCYCLIFSHILSCHIFHPISHFSQCVLQAILLVKTLSIHNWKKSQNHFQSGRHLIIYILNSMNQIVQILLLVNLCQCNSPVAFLCLHL